MIYKKIKEAKQNLLKMNAIEAAQAGAKGTGIDLNENKNESSNPITYKSSPNKKHGGPHDPKTGDKVNIDGDAHTFIRSSVNNPGSSSSVEIPEAISGGTAGTPYENKMKKLFQDGASIADLVKAKHGTTEGLTNLFKGLKQSSNTPASVTTTTSANPLTETKTQDPTQRYSMGEKQVENANWAKGRMRRGLNREERKGMKDIVKGLDPTKRQEFKDNMKAQRNIDRDGDGKTSFIEKLKNTFGGNRQQKKLNALNAIDGGSVKKEFGLKDKTIRQDVAKAAQGAYDFGDRANMSERDKKIDAASQSNYSFGLNTFGDFKAGSTTTGSVAATDDMAVVDRASLGTTTVFDSDNGMQTVDKSNPFSGMELNSDDYKIELPGAFKGLSKKGYKGKSAAAFKNRSGRGAGY